MEQTGYNTLQEVIQEEINSRLIGYCINLRSERLARNEHNTLGRDAHFAVRRYRLDVVGERKCIEEFLRQQYGILEKIAERFGFEYKVEPGEILNRIRGAVKIGWDYEPHRSLSGEEIIKLLEENGTIQGPKS